MNDRDDLQLSADEDALEGADVEISPQEDTAKPNGLGADGTIPSDPSGVAAGHTSSPSHFNPEEDEDAQ